MRSEMNELMTQFLKLAYPIRLMKLGPNTPPRGKFKKVIVVNYNNIYRVSDVGERYNAMYALSKILMRVFRVPQSETIQVIKKHLHIKD